MLQTIDESSIPRMKVIRQADGGYGLSDMSERELRSLLTMINGTGLEERRVFFHVKKEIEKLLASK